MGHGTHVAGTVAGNQFGVAKEANIITVKRSTPVSVGIAAIEFVVEEKRRKPNRPMVATMSWGALFRQSTNDAVNAANRAGIVMIASAGNEGTDACTRSPASADGAITVGATNQDDSRRNSSGFGSCIAIFAPGTGIRSASSSSDRESEVKSGTSMVCCKRGILFSFFSFLFGWLSTGVHLFTTIVFFSFCVCVSRPTIYPVLDE